MVVAIVLVSMIVCWITWIVTRFGPKRILEQFILAQSVVVETMEQNRLGWILEITSSYANMFVAFCILILWYILKDYWYWKFRGIPYFRPHIPIIGSLIETFCAPQHEWDISRYRKYGRVFGGFMGFSPCLYVGEPVLIREIMTTHFHSFNTRGPSESGHPVLDNMLANIVGEDWKRVRTIIAPTFSTRNIKTVLHIFNDCSKTVVANFRDYAENREDIELKELYGAFVIDVIASAAFSTKIDSAGDPNNEFSQNARNGFRKSPYYAIYNFFPNWFTKLCNLSTTNIKSVDFFAKAARDIVQYRRQHQVVERDFMQLLLNAAKGTLPTEAGEQENLAVSAPKKLVENEVIGQCLSFFMAGYDTVATVLAFATYFMALDQTIQDKVREEVDSVIKEHNNQITYEGLQEMKYLDKVICETLRYYPPATQNARRATASVNLTEINLVIPKGMYVFFPVYAVHHDEKLYPDPEIFNPDRFIDVQQNRKNFAYLPFGHGPRSCVGFRFAEVEIKTCLARVIAEFYLKKSPHTLVPMTFKPCSVGLLEPHAVHVQMEARADSPLID